jgi:hypothetical protein
MSLDTLLEIEDQSELWEPEVLGLKLWPIIRTVTLEPIINKQLGHNLLGREKPSYLDILSPALLDKHARTLAFLLLNPIKQQYSPLFFKTGHRDGIYKYFFERIRSPLIAETSLLGTVDEEHWNAGRVTILQDTLRILAKARGMTFRLSNGDQRKLRDFSVFICQQFHLASHLEDRLYSLMNKRIWNGLTLETLVEKCLLPRLRGRLVFVHQACYLDVHSILVKSLHELGYTVVEIQHGITHQWHWAYHYPSSIAIDGKYNSHQYFPDLFLVYGDYWSTQIRIPSKPVVVGFPGLSEAVQSLRSVSPENPNTVLMVSQGSVTEKMADITCKLSRMFPDYRIIFKLHPLEVGFVERYRALYDLPNVEVMGRVNIHPLIAQSTVLVGEGSTAMFEAVAFPNKRIFVLKNDIITAPIGTVFTEAEELIEMINDPSKGHPAYPPELFWAPDWENRIAAFLKRHLPVEEIALA